MTTIRGLQRHIPEGLVTPGQPLRSTIRVSAKHVLFCVLGLMTLFVIYHDEKFFFDHSSNTWRFFRPVLWKLCLHAVGGAVALTLGGLQFSTRLRQCNPALHRLFGRFYFGGVLLAAPMAVYLAFTHGLRTMAVETTVQASLWGVTTWMAIRAARNRKFEVHRQWVMRSYAITLIFVIDRIILALPVAPTTDAGAERLAWILVVAALLVPQLLINGRELFPGTGDSPGLSKSPE
jgi:uncharacterized membrane protein